MAKVISYKFVAGERNIGTQEEPNIVQTILPKKSICPTKASFDANYPSAEREAIPDTIEVSGEFDPEPETPKTGDVVTWDEMDAAYQEGVDSV